MAFAGFSDTGEEWALKSAFRDGLAGDDTLYLLLFNDSTDALGESSDVGAITTEPTGASYNRQPVTLDTDDCTIQATGSNSEVAFSGEFDPRDCTQTIDAWGAVVDFQSTVVNSEAVKNPHLVAMATLSQSYDLSNYSGDKHLNVTGTISLD